MLFHILKWLSVGDILAVRAVSCQMKIVSALALFITSKLRVLKCQNRTLATKVDRETRMILLIDAQGIGKLKHSTLIVMFNRKYPFMTVKFLK